MNTCILIHVLIKFLQSELSRSRSEAGIAQSTLHGHLIIHIREARLVGLKGIIVEIDSLYLYLSKGTFLIWKTGIVKFMMKMMLGNIRQQ